MSDDQEPIPKLTPIAERLPVAIAVTPEALAAFTKRDQFTQLAHLLYQETAFIVSAVARAHEPLFITQRDWAISCGLLVRIWKFMMAIATLAAAMDRCGEIIHALNRCILESAVNLMYLLKNDNPETFNDFVTKSLGPERELYDHIQTNIRQRGGSIIPMETRMLASINRVAEQSGMKIEDVPSKHQDWGENMRMKIKALGWEQLYGSYRIGSHAVHGTWVDLLMRHVEFGDEGYTPEFAFDRTDLRLLSPMARIVMDAVVAYAPQVMLDDDRKVLFERIDDLWSRSEAVSNAFEKWFQAREQESD